MKTTTMNQLVATLHRTRVVANQNLVNLRSTLAALEILGDSSDRARAIVERRKLIAEIEAEHQRITLIENALQRLADGKFGRCTGCGAEIPVRRLEIQAWSERCVGCQQEAERGSIGNPWRGPLDAGAIGVQAILSHPFNSS